MVYARLRIFLFYVCRVPRGNPLLQSDGRRFGGRSTSQRVSKGLKVEGSFGVLLPP